MRVLLFKILYIEARRVQGVDIYFSRWKQFQSLLRRIRALVARCILQHSESILFVSFRAECTALKRYAELRNHLDCILLSRRIAALSYFAIRDEKEGKWRKVGNSFSVFRGKSSFETNTLFEAAKFYVHSISVYTIVKLLTTHPSTFESINYCKTAVLYRAND